MFVKQLLVATVFFICLVSISAQVDSKAEAEKLYEEAKTLHRSNKAESMKQAIKKYEELIPVFNKLEMQKHEADANNNIGHIYKRLSQFEKSIPYFQKSAELNHQINNSQGEIFALLNMSQSFRGLGKYPEAISSINEAQKIAKAANDEEKEAMVLNELGVIYFRQGKIPNSLENFEKAAAVFERSGKLKPQVSLLNNIGLISRLYGYQDKALESYTKALKIAKALNHKEGEADININLSVAYSDMFKIDEAMKHFNNALSIFRESGNKQREAVTLNNIGVFYNALGDYTKAQDYYKQATDISQKIGDKRNYASSLKNLGISLLNIGKPDEALNKLLKALEISRSLKDRQNEGWILNNVGVVYEKKGDYSKAVDYMNQSLNILESLGNKEGIANTLYNLAGTLYLSNEKEKALSSYEKALQIRKELRNSGEIAKNLLGIAKIKRDVGDIENARKAIEEAIETVESLRAVILNQNLRSSYFALSQDIYDFYIDLLMNAGKGEVSAENIKKVFEVSEQARARSLLETLAESRTNLQQGISKELLDKEKLLRGRINARERQRVSLTRRKAKAERVKAVEQEVKELLVEYEQVKTQIKSANPKYATLIRPKPISLEKVQQEILDENTVLLQYSMGEERSYLWAITKDSVKSYKLPKYRKIFDVAKNFIDSLNSRSKTVKDENYRSRELRLGQSDKEFFKANENLSKILFPFDMEKLKGKRLVIVSEDALHYIPFSALILKNSKDSNKRKFLIENNEVINLPSISTLAFLRDSSNEASAKSTDLVAIIADPVFSKDDVRVKTELAKAKSNGKSNLSDNMNVQAKLVSSKFRSDLSRLRFSRREAEAISKFIPKNDKLVALDFDANVQLFESPKFSRAKIIHLATHGIVMSEYPGLSGIVLSLVGKDGKQQEGYLRLHDIYNLKLNADLVVLSACDTALGKDVRGEGMVGLTRGFMYAGAERVVASLWKVEDRATAELMKKFYQSMLKDGHNPTAALRLAQIQMIKDKRWKHPYYWAAFTVQGDWK